MISLIITTCDRRELLIQALDCAVGQKHVDEIIVINDGGEISKSLHQGVIYLKTRGYEGVCTARNLGLAEASMPFIAYLDDDDLLFPNAYQGAITTFKSGNHNVVVSNVEKFDERGKLSEHKPPSITKGTIWGMDYSSISDNTSFFTKQSSVYRTDFLRSVGGWEPRLRMSDISELFFRISTKSDITGIDWPCYRLRRSTSYKHASESIYLRFTSQLFLFVRHVRIWLPRKNGWRWVARECWYVCNMIREKIL